jgi:hypothetical protein
MGNILILFRQGERYFPDVRQDMLIRLGQFKKEQAQLLKLQKNKSCYGIKNPIQRREGVLRRDNIDFHNTYGYTSIRRFGGRDQESELQRGNMNELLVCCHRCT